MLGPNPKEHDLEPLGSKELEKSCDCRNDKHLIPLIEVIGGMRLRLLHREVPSLVGRCVVVLHVDD